MPSWNQQRPRRGKSKLRASTQIGPLDIVESASPQVLLSARTLSDEFDNGVSDEELMQFDASISVEQELMAGASRRSSPTRDRIPDSSWNFDPSEDSEYEEPIPPMSSPKVDNLPDTVPIPTSQEIDLGVPPAPKKHGVDLSETASTAQRSPSVRESEAWGFDWGTMLPSSRTTSKRQINNNGRSSAAGHEFLDEFQESASSSSPSKLQQETATGLCADDHLSEASDVGTARRTQPPSIVGQVETVPSAKSRMIDNGNSTEAGEPVAEVHSVSLNRSNRRQNRQSLEKVSTRDKAPVSSVGSGKKRKQWAKEPLIFDSATQAVKEGPPQKKRSPPMPKSAVKAAEKSASKSAPPAAAVKRPANKAPVRPAKKPRVIAPLDPSSSKGTPRRSHGRAAAQAARAAVQQQLSSSPSSHAKPAKKAGIETSIVQKPPPAANDNVNRQQLKDGFISKPDKIAEQATRHKKKGPSSAVFGGASGKMYTATQPKLHDKMVKDSQEDTQDSIRAHLAEERKAKDHISISSGHSSDPTEAQKPMSQLPKPASKVDDTHEGAPQPQQQPQTQPPVQVQARVSQNKDDMPGPAVMISAYRKSTRVAELAKGGVREAPAAPITTSGKNKGTRPPLLNNDHFGPGVFGSKKEPEGSRDAKPRSLSQRSARPDDAFVANDKPNERGRPLVKTSVLNRTLSVSQAGSPSRPSNDGNENLEPQSFRDIPSATSTEMKLDLAAPKQGVRRRLSYEPAPAKPRQAPKCASTEVTAETNLIDETTLVDPESSSHAGMKADPERSHEAPSHPDLSRIKNKIYDQISAADQVQKQDVKAPITVQAPSPMEARRTNIAINLHGIIDLVTQRLEQSETTVAHTVLAYEDGINRCVERIERRLNTEQALLRKQWENDKQLFDRCVSKAKQSIESAPETQRKAISTFERDVAQREMLYDQAEKSLRAFHDQIMG